MLSRSLGATPLRLIACRFPNGALSLSSGFSKLYGVGSEEKLTVLRVGQLTSARISTVEGLAKLN
jgi:hypothetical protein